MGAWSVDVLGNDDALDFLCVIEDTIGMENLYPLSVIDDLNPLREALESHMDHLLSIANGKHALRDTGRDKVLVLAGLCLATGAAMSDQLRTLAFAAAHLCAQDAEADGWVSPRERETYMLALAHKIESHQPGEIVDLGHRGLFETIAESFSTQTHSPN